LPPFDGGRLGKGASDATAHPVAPLPPPSNGGEKRRMEFRIKIYWPTTIQSQGLHPPPPTAASLTTPATSPRPPRTNNNQPPPAHSSAPARWQCTAPASRRQYRPD